MDSLETESFRKQFGDVSLFGTFRPLKENGCVRAEFVNYLTTCATGRTGDTVIVDDRDGADLDFRPKLCDRRKYCGALGAIRHPVGSVLHVATGENFPIREKHRGSHAKFRVGRIRVPHNFLGGSQQFGLHTCERNLLAHKQKA